LGIFEGPDNQGRHKIKAVLNVKRLLSKQKAYECRSKKRAPLTT